MTERKKNILVIARHNQAEALRVAGGLSLLSDIVKVVVLGKLQPSPAVTEQVEILEFAEVPLETLNEPAHCSAQLAASLIAADTVYVL